MRRLPPILLLVMLALALPAGADAGSGLQHFNTPASAPKLTPKQTLRKAEAAVAGRVKGDGHQLTPLLKDLAAKLPALSGSDRVRANRLLARPTLGDSGSSDTPYSVPEHNPPLCSVHFCIHWVDTTSDAPPLTDANGNGIPDYVETMDGVFEHVYDVENGQLGWQAPKSDGAKGCTSHAPSCMDKTDVYIADVATQGIFGYSAPDPNQGQDLHQYAYLVMDNDYSAQQFPQYGGDALPPMEVTAAHEYNHVLQFGYDVAQDNWMFESTAVWMEDKVYTEVNDYLQYVRAWVQMSFVPLTQFDLQRSDNPLNAKVYGDGVWNRWLDAKFGQDTIRNAWEHSLTSTPKSFAPAAYGQALAARHSSFFDAFSQFAADTAEWRSSNSPFAEGNTFPDVDRVSDSSTGKPIELRVNSGGAGGQLDHTTFGLLDAVHVTAPRVKLVLNAPRGVQMAVGLIGRVGDPTSGTYTSAVKRLPNGGPASVTIDDPARFSRLTGALINADGRTTGSFSRTLQDWEWVGDGAKVSARLSTDYTPPTIRSRSPGPRRSHVSRRPHVLVRFSEKMMNVNTRTVLLIGPGHHKVKARVKLTSGRKLTLIPSASLRSRARYTLRLGGDVRDLGGNGLRSALRAWSFRTR